jgi:putative endonuclease
VLGVTRTARQALGRTGEQIAAEHLERRGFRILERNYQTRWGELDIVAFDGATLVFCEVKSRTVNPRFGAPFDAVHHQKRAQVRKIARSWLASRADRPFATAIRFDAIGVVFDRGGELVALEHLEAAF